MTLVTVTVPAKTVTAKAVVIQVPAQTVTQDVTVTVPSYQIEVDVPDTPPPTVKASWGVYNGQNATDDDSFATMVGVRPRFANTYYQSNRSTLADIDRVQRAADKTTPLISIATKGAPSTLSSTGFLLWKDIAAGKYDAFYTSWGKSIAAFGGPTIYVTIDQEPEVRLNQNTIPAQSMSDYAAAWRRVRNIIRPLTSKAKFVYWVGGSDRAKIAAGYPGGGNVDLITYDPYTWASHPATERPATCWAPFADWIRAQSWYSGEPLALSETGVDISKFGQPMAADWYSKMPAAANNLGLAFVNLFNRIDGANVWRINDYPQVISAYSAAVKTMA